MSTHKSSKILLVLIMVVILSGCTTIIPKVQKFMNEPIKGPSWDVTLDIPLVHEYKVPVGQELAKELGVDSDDPLAELSYSGQIEGSDPVSVDLSGLTFQEVIDLDEQVGTVIDDVIAEFENPVTPFEFSYPFSAIEEVTESFAHTEEFDFDSESQEYMDQITDSMAITSTIAITAGEDYENDLASSLNFNQTFSFDDNTGDYIADIETQLDIHEEYAMTDKSGDVAGDISSFLDFTTEAEIPDDSSNVIDEIRSDFAQQFDMPVNMPVAVDNLDFNSKVTPLGTFTTIDMKDANEEPAFKYAIFTDGQIKLTVTNNIGTNITNMSVSVCNYSDDSLIGVSNVVDIANGATANLLVDLSDQLMEPVVYLIIRVTTAGSANGNLSFDLGLDPNIEPVIKKIVVNNPLEQVTNINQALPASDSGISKIDFATGVLRIEVQEDNQTGMSFDTLDISIANLAIGDYTPQLLNDAGNVKTYSLDGLPIDFDVAAGLTAQVTAASDTFIPGCKITVNVTTENVTIAEATFADPIVVNESLSQQISFSEVSEATLSSGVLDIALAYEGGLTVNNFTIALGGQPLTPINGSPTQFSLANVDLTTVNGFLDVEANFEVESNKYVPDSIITVDVSAADLGISRAVLTDPIAVNSKADGKTVSQELTVEKVQNITFAAGQIDIDLGYVGGLTIDPAQFTVQVGDVSLPCTVNGQRVSVDLTGQTLTFPVDSNILELAVDFVVSSDTYVSGEDVTVDVAVNNLGIATAQLKEPIAVNETITEEFALTDIQSVDFADGILNITIDYAGGININTFDISIGGQPLTPLDDTFTQFSLAGVSLAVPEGATGLELEAIVQAEASTYVGGEDVNVNVELTDISISKAVLKDPIVQEDTISREITRFSFEGIDVESFTVTDGILQIDFTYTDGLAPIYNFDLSVGGVVLELLDTEQIDSGDPTLIKERNTYNLSQETFVFEGATMPVAISYRFELGTYLSNSSIAIGAQLDQFEIGEVRFSEGSVVEKHESIEIDVPTDVSEITFASGLLSIVNRGLQVDADIDIAIAGNSLPKGVEHNTFDLTDYTIDMSELVNNKLTVDIDASIPLDTIVIGDARELVIAAEFSDLDLKEAALADPESISIDRSETVPLKDIEGLKSLKFGSGSLTMVIDDGGLELQTTDPVLAINGDPLTVTSEIDGTKHIYTVDLSDLTFDLTTMDEIAFDIQVTASATKYVKGKQITIDTSLNDVIDNLEMELDFVEEIDLDLSVLDEIDGANELLDTLKLNRNAFDVNLYFRNSSPITLTLADLVITGYKNEEEVIQEILNIEIPAKTEHYNLIENNEFLDKLFNIVEAFPENIQVKFGKFTTSNPSGEQVDSLELGFEGGDYTVNLGFALTDSVEMKPFEQEELAVELPVEDFKIDSMIEAAILFIEVENHLPIDGEITVLLSSDPAKVYTEPELTKKFVLPEAEVDANGRVVQSATFENQLKLENSELVLLKGKMYAGLVIKMNQGGQERMMTLSINDYLSLRMWAKVTVKVNQENQG